MKAGRYFSAAALVLMVAQPCFAAEDVRDRAMAHRSSAAFAGAAFKMRWGERAKGDPPSLRLQLGMTHSYQDRQSASPADIHRVTGLELGASPKGRPSFRLGGRDFEHFERQLGVNGSTEWCC